MRILQIIFLVICHLSFVIHTAHAVGIAVSPPTLELKGAGKKITNTFTVTNPSRETVVYEVSHDGLLPLTFTPTTFLLAPGKQAKVTVEYMPAEQGADAARLATQLSILGRPLSVNPTQAASGVKLPVIIRVGARAGASIKKIDPLTVAIGVIDGGLGIWLLYAIAQRTRAQRKKIVG